jgi:hypothetical protein
MVRTKQRWVATGAAAAAITTAAVVSLAPPASALTISSYSTAVTPSAVVAGSSTPFTFTFTNTSTGIGVLFNLGSVSVTAPAGFTVSGPLTASASNGSTWTASQSGNTVCLTGGTALSPGETSTLGLLAMASASDGQWSTTGYPSTNCSGLLGSFPYSADDQPTTQVDGLAWTQQPPDGARVGVALNPAPRVSATHGGSIDASFNGPITLTLNPPAGGLTGTTTVNATNGTATFTGLSIANPGFYRLRASSNGSAFVPSVPFAVGTSGSSTPCPPDQTCTSPTLRSTKAAIETITRVAADAAAPGDVLNVTVGGLPKLPCTGTQKGATMSFTVPTRTALIQLAYDDDADHEALHGNTRAKDVYNGPIATDAHPVCYQSDQAFTDVNGNSVRIGFLRACAASGNVRPCVAAEWAAVEGADSHGVPVVDLDEYEADVLAPAGDPGIGLH